jgi:hypothetical protein
MKTKYVAMAALAGILILPLAACGGADSASSDPQPPLLQHSRMDRFTDRLAATPMADRIRSVTT